LQLGLAGGVIPPARLFGRLAFALACLQKGGVLTLDAQGVSVYMGGIEGR
jgi:hypothetical protein